MKLFLLSAFSRALDGAYREPRPHFHASPYEHNPEVCYEGACERPRLRA